MCTLATHLEAACESRVLIRVYQRHSFDDPEYDVIEYGPQLAQGRHILYRIELLESALLLASHHCGRHVERRKPERLDLSMNPIDSGAPSQHDRRA